MKKIMFMVTLAAMTLMSCGGNNSSNESNTEGVVANSENNDESNEVVSKDLGKITADSPALPGSVQEYFDVIEVTPLVLTCEEGRVSSQLTSQYLYAKGSVKLKCKKDKQFELGDFPEYRAILLDENGSPLYDGKAGTGHNSEILDFKREPYKAGNEYAFNYSVCIEEDRSTPAGIVTDAKLKNRILGPVKKVRFEKY